MKSEPLIYKVDSADIIISIGDNWHAFANANAWHSAMPPEAVLGHKLWEFIQDNETRYFYRELFRRARTGTKSRPIPFRCDSPGERRFLELQIDAQPDGLIEITSTIVRTEIRAPIKILAADTLRSTDLIRICSICKKIEVAPEQWTDIEEGLTQVRLFEAEEMPQLSHVVCQQCYDEAILNLDNV